MSHARTIPEGLQAIETELREVEWFGRVPPERHSLAGRAPAALDVALVVGGAVLGAALYLLWV